MIYYIILYHTIPYYNIPYIIALHISISIIIVINYCSSSSGFGLRGRVDDVVVGVVVHGVPLAKVLFYIESFLFLYKTTI